MACPITLSMELAEDEEDLFEIDLNAVDNIPPPKYYCESDVTAMGSALLANCLLPISDLSSAVPMVSSALSFAGSGNAVVIGEPIMPLGKKLIIQLSSLCDLKARF